MLNIYIPQKSLMHPGASFNYKMFLWSVDYKCIFPDYIYIYILGLYFHVCNMLAIYLISTDFDASTHKVII